MSSPHGIHVGLLDRLVIIRTETYGPADMIQYGIVYQLGIANKSTSISVYLLSWIYMVVAVAIYPVIMHAHDKYAAKEHIYYRAVKLFVICLMTLVVIILLRFTSHLQNNQFTGSVIFLANLPLSELPICVMSAVSFTLGWHL
ncbi:callose synthase 12-like isoform X2 [Magnolia sinica]|uniref:callose synthase 12-like isoform X2 n=1 Tax=Magnolia sinica TaxID=86752 RepID=UPI002658D3A8|nr:callose synthase 12-like isoform X2 [Magnolia sinica]